MIDSKGRGPLARCYHTAWFDGKIISYDPYKEPHLFLQGGKQSDKG